MTKKQKLHKKCGTCNIINTELLVREFHLDLIDINSTHEELIDSADGYQLQRMQTHGKWPSYFHNMKEYPHRAAIYTRVTDENITGKNHSRMFKYSKTVKRRHWKRNRKKFNLPKD